MKRGQEEKGEGGKEGKRGENVDGDDLTDVIIPS